MAPKHLHVTVPYEAFFGLIERPFSLTPDPRFFFKSHTHGGALERLTFALRRREGLSVVTGEAGVGKTTFCQTFVERCRRKYLVGFVRDPLLTTRAFYQGLFDDLSAQGEGAPPRRAPEHTTTAEAREALTDLLARLRHPLGAVVIVDDAHVLPEALVEEIRVLAELERDGRPVLPCVLVGQPPAETTGPLGMTVLDALTTTHARLEPLGREECAAYVAHRLVIAGAGTMVRVTPRAYGAIFGLTRGVPRLVNLLCERALQDSASRGSRQVGVEAIETAASDLQLNRRRFRWFTGRAS
ncbi:MAG: ExeA family protein [Acidobacteriota bacterium]